MPAVANALMDALAGVADEYSFWEYDAFNVDGQQAMLDVVDAFIVLSEHAAEIVRCLKDNRFQLAFQPVVDGQSAEPVFHEALLRMTAEDGRIVPVDWWAVIFNPSFPYRLVHMLLASGLTATFLMLQAKQVRAGLILMAFGSLLEWSATFLSAMPLFAD